MLNKKAQGHLEMIISFVFFIGVLVVIFIFINPFAKTPEKKLDIDRIKEVIIKNVSVGIGKVSVIISDTGNCYNISTQYSGTRFTEVRDPLNIRKYTIYSSTVLDDNADNDVRCDRGNYTLGVYSEQDTIVYEKIEDLRARYQSNYATLKSELGIRNDFSFLFKKLDNSIIQNLSVSKEIRSGIEADSREFPILVINKSGDIFELIINVRSW